jgi:hypothetical protein
MSASQRRKCVPDPARSRSFSAHQSEKLEVRSRQSLSGIELFKHLPDACLEALEKDSHILNCCAGHLFFSGRPDRQRAFRPGEGLRSHFPNLWREKANDCGASTSRHIRRNGLLWPGKVPFLSRSPPGFPRSIDFARKYHSSLGMRSSCDTQARRLDERAKLSLSPQDGDPCS